VISIPRSLRLRASWSMMPSCGTGCAPRSSMGGGDLLPLAGGFDPSAVEQRGYGRRARTAASLPREGPDLTDEEVGLAPRGRSAVGDR